MSNPWQGLRMLLLFDARGLDCFDASPDGMRRALRLMVPVAPFYILSLMQLGHAAPEVRMGLDFYLAACLTYVVGWLAWPVLVHMMAGWMGLGACYFRYMVPHLWMRALAEGVSGALVFVGFQIPAAQVGLLLLQVLFLAYAIFLLAKALQPSFLAGVSMILMMGLIGMLLGQVMIDVAGLEAVAS